jgi:hypothetical protein
MPSWHDCRERGLYDHAVLAIAAPAVGALVGLVIGCALSVYVFRLDRHKQLSGVRSRAEYRGSLVVTPLLLAGIGALLALAIAAIF